MNKLDLPLIVFLELTDFGVEFRSGSGSSRPSNKISSNKQYKNIEQPFSTHQENQIKTNQNYS